MSMPPKWTDPAYRDLLHQVHCERMRAHWGPKANIADRPWPKDDAEWKLTTHGAAWDSNVNMAEWTLNLARGLVEKGLVKP